MLSLSRQLEWAAQVHTSESPQERFDLVKMWLFVVDNPIGIAQYCLVALTIRNPGKGGAAEPSGLVKAFTSFWRSWVKDTSAPSNACSRYMGLFIQERGDT